MKIETELVNNGAILTVHGKIMIDEEVDDLRLSVENMLKMAAVRTIVLDLGDVPYVDCAGLGELVRCHTTTGKWGRELALCCLTPKIKDLLAITKLLTVFEIYDTREEAVASFS